MGYAIAMFGVANIGLLLYSPVAVLCEIIFVVAYLVIASAIDAFMYRGGK